MPRSAPLAALAAAALSPLALTAPAAAQCTPVAPEALRTFDPWAAAFHTWASNQTSSLNLFFDLDVQSAIEIGSLSIPTYSQGAGSPTIPNQVGNIAEVRIYLIAGTRTGNEANAAAWGLAQAGMPDARGELTITAFPGDSPIANLKDANGTPAPLVVPAGTYGVCIEVLSTSWNGTALIPGQTNVPLLNPGRIESIVGWQNPITSWSDAFLTLDNGGVQQSGWRATDTGGNLIPNPNPSSVSNTLDLNLAIDYLPGAAGATVGLPFGAGCYDSPRAVYERGLAASTAIDLANTQWTLAFVPDGSGGHYDVGPGGPAFDGASAVANGIDVLALTPTSSSASGWDDASLVYPLPAGTFAGGLPFPGGSCTAVTINSNGRVFLGSTTDPSPQTNGHDGSLASFRDLLPQLAPFHVDLDPTNIGELRIEDPSPRGGIRITWLDTPPWGTTGNRSDFQLELLPSGEVTFVYGPRLANPGFAPAIVGFSAGGGQSLGTSTDWSAITQHTTGTGASAPQLSFSGPPVINTTIDAIVSQLGGNPAQPIGGFLAFGFASLPTGLPLDSYGLSGCESHLDLGLVLFSVLLANPNNTELRWPWTVPAAANGVPVYLQGGVFGPTAGNAVGITLTNGLCAQIGM
ncbi:MAG: hypothetical protein KDE27_06110 [Planctomycetes bacterium]|nr:hypothetical protein [Planctomycetota bacterium]